MEEQERVKLFLQDNLPRLLSPCQLDCRVEEGALPSSVLRKAQTKVNRLLQQKGKELLGAKAQKTLLDTISSQREQHERQRKQLKRKRPKDFRWEDLAREWPHRQASQQLQQRYSKQRKRIAAYAKEISEVRERKKQYQAVLGIIKQINLDKLESSTEGSIVSELQITQKLLVSIKDRLTDPSLQRNLTLEAKGADTERVDRANQVLLQFLSTAQQP